MRQPTLHQNEGEKNHGGEVKEVERLQYLIKGIRNYRITKDLVWEVNEEILSVKLDHTVKVYLYDSAWGELRALHKIMDMQIRSKRCPMQLKF
jgi:hypothetical protein